MNTLTPNECRVLGVLVEKAHTTAAQYPLSLNAVVAGCNQKNNRAPVLHVEEAAVQEALDSLMPKRLVHEIMMSGSRVLKYKHSMREGLELSTSEVVVLAELLLRGPQTVGELRGRASRMHPLESTEIVGNVLDHMMQREPPLVHELPPAPGSRAARYAQLLCPDLHDLTTAPAPAEQPPSVDDGAMAEMRSQITELRAAVKRLADSVGAADPFG